MGGYVWWTAITALVISVVALGMAFAAMRRQPQRDNATPALCGDVQGYRLAPSGPFQEKWDQEIKKHEAGQEVTISPWAAALAEAVYQPPQIVVRADQFGRQ